MNGQDLDESFDTWRQKVLMEADDSALEPSSEPLTPEQSHEWEAIKAKHFAVYSQLAEYAESKGYVHYATHSTAGQWNALDAEDITNLQEPGYLDYWLLHPYLCRTMGASMGNVGETMRTYVTARRVSICIQLREPTDPKTEQDLTNCGSWENASNAEIVTCSSLETAISLIEAWADSIKRFESSPWFFDQEKTPCTFHNHGNGWSYYAPPYEAARAYVDYYEAHPRPGFATSYDWILPTQVINETTNVTGFGIVRTNDTQIHPTPPTRSTPQRLWNAPAIGMFTELSANYSNKDLFTIYPDHLKAIFQSHAKWGGYFAELDAQKALSGTWDPLERDPNLTTQRIWAVIDSYGNTTRNEALIAMYVLSRLTDTQNGLVRIGFRELLDFEKVTHYGAKDREERAKKYDSVFRQWDAWKAIGKRKWKDPTTGKIRTIEEASALFIYNGPYYLDGQTPPPGMYKAPAGYTFLDSPITKDYREDPTLRFQLGTLQHLAQIPGGKPGGDWAKSIGLAAIQAIRKDAKHGGKTKSLTRRYLLTTHTPNTPVQKILDGDDPGNARQYWKSAIGILTTEPKIFETVEEPTPPQSRRGWAEEWLEQCVTITLAGPWATSPANVFDSIQKKSQRPKRKPSHTKPSN